MAAPQVYLNCGVHRWSQADQLFPSGPSVRETIVGDAYLTPTCTGTLDRGGEHQGGTNNLCSVALYSNGNDCPSFPPVVGLVPWIIICQSFSMNECGHANRMRGETTPNPIIESNVSLRRVPSSVAFCVTPSHLGEFSRSTSVVRSSRPTMIKSNPHIRYTHKLSSASLKTTLLKVGTAHAHGC